MENKETKTFGSYDLSKDILHALELLGYQTPTNIQCAVIPPALEGKHIVAKAPTGSGKTAAFAIPICEKVIWEEKAPQALILEPARELAVQVKDEVFRIGRKKRLKVAALFGGFPIDKQIQTLRQKNHVIVGTPGRVMDHLRRGTLNLNGISHLVIDEADLMLDMGFIEEVKEILNMVPKGCVVSLFSATLKPEIQKIVQEYMNDAEVVIQDRDKELTSSIIQKIYQTDLECKFDTFIDVLVDENPNTCIIFCGTREMVHTLFQKLRRKGIFCGMLHGEMEQKERLKTVDDFRRGYFPFLIATDVAARGIDFDYMSHVINYDFPTGRETYVHRIGRTGRNGKSGTAISLLCEEEFKMFHMVEEYMGQSIPIKECPKSNREKERLFLQNQKKKPIVRPRKEERLTKDILAFHIGGGRKSKIRAGDIVGTICSIEGVAVDDIGIIDIRDSFSYVEVINGKGKQVLEALQTKTLKGKVRKVRVTKKNI